MVVRYGQPVSINCSALTDQNGGMGWEATEGGTGLLEDVRHLNWTVDRLTEWDASPKCFINPRHGSSFRQCGVRPEVVVYSESHLERPAEQSCAACANVHLVPQPSHAPLASAPPPLPTAP